MREGNKDESMNNEVLNSKIKRLEMDNLHLRTQTENLRNSNAKVTEIFEIFNFAYHTISYHIT